MSVLQSADPAIWNAIVNERRRQVDGLELIASENYTSAAVMEAAGTVLTNKYAEGYPESDTTAVVRMSMSLRTSRGSEHSSCLVPNMPTCSLMPVHRRTWQPT